MMIDEVIHMHDTFQRQQTFFRSNQTKPLAFRVKQLDALEEMIHRYEERILEALFADLHKSPFEAYTTEIGYCLKSIRYARRHLKRWMKPKKVKTPIYQLNTRSYIQADPLGTILIIGPYNYPFQLVIEPLIGAIAAGNTAILKPSEQTPATEALLAEMIHETFDPEFVRVFTGDALVTQELLTFRFDHVFFTGSTFVGQKIYEAASKNLVPVTLELGGKSPTIVDQTADLTIAARRIAFGKFINAGQTCIAPDYIYVERSIHDAFVRILNATIRQFYAHYEDFGRLVNAKHFHRLMNLIEHETTKETMETKEEDRFIAPTVLTDVTWDDAIMKEEIFGPLLPVLQYDSLDEVIERIKDGERPLALYLFTKDKDTEQRVFSELSFGGGAINDTLMHVNNHHLPFGGIGASGIGQYHGKHSFDLFSHQKGYIKRSFLWDPPIAYPPYTKRKESLIRRILK
jgi:aldehyde dehydrogenase (NAD+)